MWRSTVDRRGELCRDALVVIEARLAEEDLSLAVVATAIATSRRQLQRVLAESAGTTFRCELRRARLERAAELLDSRAVPVKEVAAAVGYRDPAQFSKAFRIHHGATPSSFQRDRAEDNGSHSPVEGLREALSTR